MKKKHKHLFHLKPSKTEIGFKAQCRCGLYLKRKELLNPVHRVYKVVPSNTRCVSPNLPRLGGGKL